MLRMTVHSMIVPLGSQVDASYVCTTPGSTVTADDVFSSPADGSIPYVATSHEEPPIGILVQIMLKIQFRNTPQNLAQTQKFVKLLMLHWSGLSLKVIQIQFIFFW